MRIVHVVQEVLVPNKTIYVSDEDMPLFERARELAGGSLSAAIGTALRRYIEAEEAREEGYEEITVRVGVGVGRKVRFSGVLLVEWGRTAGGRVEEYKVYRTRSGKYAVHRSRGPEYSGSEQETGNWVRDLTSVRTWRAYLGIDEHSWTMTQGESTLDVAASLEELATKVPQPLYDIVAALADQPAVEDLDL
jgi:EXLDI family protein